MLTFTQLEGTIEIDEAIWRKRKFNRGRMKVTFWILGFFEGSNDPYRRRCFFIPILNRTKETMQFYIVKICKPGSTIITNEYASYKFLHLQPEWSQNYLHKWVNHSENYVDPTDSNVHTNNTEGLVTSKKSFASKWNSISKI